VRILTLRTGQAALLPRKRVSMEETLREQVLYIGGTVRLKSKDPAAGIQVAIKGTGLVSTSDKEEPPCAQPGNTLDARLQMASPKKVNYSPAPKDGNYDLEVG
jgi:hypothetical protein